MRTRTSEALPASRGKTGFAILVVASILLALFHTGMQDTDPKSESQEQVNLPLPVNQGTVQLSDPSVLDGPIAHAAYHASHSCNVGAINGAHYDTAVSVDRGANVGLGGWIADQTNQDVPASAWIVLADTNKGRVYYAPITFWMSRPDVKEALGGARGYARAGFISNFITDRLPLGQYHLYVEYQTGSLYYTCDEGRHLMIGPVGDE